MNKATLIVIVCIFLAVLGGGIWKRTHMAVAPPIWDPISYYSRAELVWSALAKGDLHGILNGPMAVRPPGTAFVLYPIGFKPSIRSFLFRSVFAPILIWAIALFIPIATQVKSRSDAFLGSAFIIGLISLPLFYHFEFSDAFTKVYVVANQWGMVDSLEAAIAALATSLLCMGIAKESVKWCSLGWFVCAFSFFIKPSGLLVMMALVGVATVELFIHFFGTRSSRRVFLKLAAPAYLVGLSIFCVALWLALSSDYMSREVIDQSVKGQQFVLSLNQGQELFAMLALLVVPVIGWWWFCPGVLFAALVAFEAVQLIGKRRWSVTAVRLAVAGIIMAAAICWWIFLAGQQHRYLFPFLLMLIAWLVPEIFQRAREFAPSAKGAVIGYCLAPAFLLAWMLWSKQQPIIFQQLIGVNLTTGSYAAEVDQGKWLLAESKNLGRPLNLYSLGNYGEGVVEMVDWVKSIEKKNAPHRFVVRRPLNWVDTPGLRAEELVHSDFLLLENIRPGGAGEAPTVSSWSEEVERFKQFAYSERGVERNGLELVSDGSVKLLRVADASKFSEALYKWANSIQWTNDFRDRNKDFLQNPPK
jgi:hypothetical protein